MLLLKDKTGSKATGLSGKHDTNSLAVHQHVTRSVYSQVDSWRPLRLTYHSAVLKARGTGIVSTSNNISVAV